MVHCVIFYTFAHDNENSIIYEDYNIDLGGSCS